jgi:hypothetical protein
MPPYDGAGRRGELAREMPDPARGAVDQNLAAESFTQSCLVGDPDPKCVCKACSGAGIWHGGGGIAGDDAGNVYLMTGNGEYNSASLQFGDSFIKLGGEAGRFAPVRRPPFRGRGRREPVERLRSGTPS